ncbi:fibrinogen alpha chain [Dunckerocampus dactyliophorus]|uniref:fibrinogen alpha chain n=1 Tax=Dunckerocampus dactyliophorus TaxID=161453 RepID=UPI0024075AF2|nr:fibrinogen alpha chain [Dunckerocampus dactyliophorus]
MIQMERASLLAFVCTAASLASALDPRGPRPVEPATRSEKCGPQREWPFCTDDDWGPKCPSGCRIQGLMDYRDHSLLKKIEKITSLLESNKLRHRSADEVTKQTYEYLKDKLTLDTGHDDRYYNLAQNLRQRISEMKVKIDRQLRVLGALRDRVADQAAAMQKLEVDIDIKLRSCKGSCKTYSVYQVDRDSYVTLDKQVSHLQSQGVQRIDSVKTLEVMKSTVLQGVILDNVYKSVDQRPQDKQDIFNEVKTLQLTLEQEGSSSYPATISKVPHTSSASSPPPGSSTPSKSITELTGSNGGDLFAGGGLDKVDLPTFDTSSCVKTIKRTMVMTKGGPVEKIEETSEDNPACQGGSDTKGGLNSFGHASSTIKIVNTGGVKGSHLDTKTGFTDLFPEVGFDLGKFFSGHTDDDVPDVHARGVKTTHVERQSDYTGKDCIDIFHKHTEGETSGMFKIKPAPAAATVAVYCQQEGLMGGWLLVQQRENGVLDFNRTWEEYRRGFGGVDAQGRGEVWLGNQNLHLLTSQGESLLKVELQDGDGGVASAEYVMSVGLEEDGYPLRLSGYSGDAGDAMTATHHGMKFSTWDRDNDGAAGNCAATRGGGWWYNQCQSANLNGIYHGGVVWSNRSLKRARMFVRPATF